MRVKRELRVGARVGKFIQFGGESGGKRKDVPAEGRIVYVHPQGRYYTVEFRLDKGNIRESYSCCFAARVAEE